MINRKIQCIFFLCTTVHQTIWVVAKKKDWLCIKSLSGLINNFALFVCSVECPENKWAQLCDKSCSTNCTGGCDRLTGACLKCPEGKWKFGTFCEKTCESKRCKGGSCHRYDGSCDKGCIGSYKGRFCLSCNALCRNGDCYDNGTCGLSGCIDGKYGYIPGFGITCNLSCSVGCIQQKCQFWNGKCIDGCVDGYKGFRCHINCAERCDLCGTCPKAKYSFSNNNNKGCQPPPS